MASETIKRVRLGEVCEISRNERTCNDENIWLLNLDVIEQQTGRVLNRVVIPRCELGQSTVPFDTRCVLYSKLRPNLNKVVVPDAAGYATSELLPLVPVDGVITREYLAAFLRSDNFVQYATTKSFGAKMPRLGTKDLMAVQIPLPPLPVQRRIAAALDKISEMKRNAEARLQKLDLLVKARFNEMFGDCEKVVPLSLMGRISTGATPSMKVAEYYDNSDYCFVKPSDLAYDVVQFSDSESHISKRAETVARMYNPGAVLVTCIGATIGKLGIAKVRGTCNQQINIVEPNDTVDSVYLAYALQSRKDALVAAANSTAVPILNKSEFSKFKLPLPNLSLQRSFAAFVEKVEALKATAQASLARVDLLYRAKLQEYFG